MYADFHRPLIFATYGSHALHAVSYTAAEMPKCKCSHSSACSVCSVLTEHMQKDYENDLVTNSCSICCYIRKIPALSVLSVQFWATSTLLTFFRFLLLFLLYRATSYYTDNLLKIKPVAPDLFGLWPCYKKAYSHQKSEYSSNFSAVAQSCKIIHYTYKKLICVEQLCSFPTHAPDVLYLILAWPLVRNPLD